MLSPCSSIRQRFDLSTDSCICGDFVGKYIHLHEKGLLLPPVYQTCLLTLTSYCFNYRIGRGNDQVWYHDNFLRGKPDDMKLMVRTKIKGDTAISSEDVRAPNFDDLPPLPVCDKRPSAILDVMENAILKMPSPSGAIAHTGSSMSTVSPPQLGNFFGDTNHQMSMPKTETPCHFNVSCNQDESSFQIPSPPLFHRAVSNESQFMMLPYVPNMHFHLPLQADTIKSAQPTQQASIEEPCHPTYSDMMRDNVNDSCSSPLTQNSADFEPLPFMDDNIPFDDFASFIEGAIQQIEG